MAKNCGLCGQRIPVDAWDDHLGDHDLDRAGYAARLKKRRGR